MFIALVPGHFYAIEYSTRKQSILSILVFMELSISFV